MERTSSPSGDRGGRGPRHRDCGSPSRRPITHGPQTSRHSRVSSPSGNCGSGSSATLISITAAEFRHRPACHVRVAERHPVHTSRTWPAQPSDHQTVGGSSPPDALWLDRTGVGGCESSSLAGNDREDPSRSPWIHQLEPDPRSTSRYRCERPTWPSSERASPGSQQPSSCFATPTSEVLLIERDRAGRGATGHNAGQLTTYFERPLFDLVDSYGFDKAIAAQRAIDDSWDLLDIIVDESGAQVRIDRFIGHLGMFALNHVKVHLRELSLRQRGGLRVASCVVSENAEFLGDIPSEYSHLYSVVTPAHVRELLGTTDDRYHAVMSDVKGCVNGALLIEQVLELPRLAVSTIASGMSITRQSAASPSIPPPRRSTPEVIE